MFAYATLFFPMGAVLVSGVNVKRMNLIWYAALVQISLYLSWAIVAIWFVEEESFCLKISSVAGSLLSSSFQDTGSSYNYYGVENTGPIINETLNYYCVENFKTLFRLPVLIMFFVFLSFTVS